MTMQQAFKYRSYRHTDAAAVVQVVNGAAAESLGTPRGVVDSVGNVRLMRYVPVTSEKIVALNARNEVVGYAYLVDREQHIVYEVGGAVHPAYWGKGIGSEFLDWAEQRAQSLSSRAPVGVKTVMQANLFEGERAAIELFTHNGYTKVREWLHLAIDLYNPPIVPALPEGLSLREMDLENDWDIVGPAMDEAFTDHWGAISLPLVEPVIEEEPLGVEIPEDDSYSNAPGFCFIVVDKNRVAGGILCNDKIVEQIDTGRVGSLFVRPQYRRQGIGRILMLTAFLSFWQHGIQRIVTDTDAASFSDAPAFYTGLGMSAYRREFLFEKTIRPGREVRRLTV